MEPLLAQFPLAPPLLAVAIGVVSLLCMRFWSRNVYAENRLGKSRLWSLVTGQQSVRWTIDKIAEEGYFKYNKVDKPFVMNWWGADCLFMPVKYLDDIKRAAFEDMSFFQSLSDAFNLHASVGDLYDTTTMIDVVKRRLNPQLPTLVPILAEEANYAFEKELGDAEEWKSFGALKLCSSLLHRVTSRILIGEELCRSEEYVESSLKFSESVFMNGIKGSTLSFGIFKTPITWLLSIPHRRNLARVMKQLVPIVELRLEEAKLGDAKPIHVDAVQWTVELASGSAREKTPERLAQQILQNLWAGSGAPGGLVTQMLYNTLMFPEHHEPLRQEIATAVAEHGWTDKALTNMPLLESFVRETNRLYPNGSITSARTIMRKPFTFNDGLTLPRGTRIAFPIRAIQIDPDNFASPMQFDGFRFARASGIEGMKDKSDGKDGKEAPWGAATLSKTNLAFGYGRHACVGRYYAVRKVKLVYAKMLLEYEFRWAEDGDKKDRPASFCVEGQFVPNMEQEVLVRRRKQGEIDAMVGKVKEKGDTVGNS